MPFVACLILLSTQVEGNKLRYFYIVSVVRRTGLTGKARTNEVFVRIISTTAANKLLSAGN
jgi:hypothetical protein